MGPHTAAPTSQSKVGERAPRKLLSLAVSLLVQGEELSGYCMDISSSGMLILLPHELPSYLVWSLGHLTGVIENSPFRLRVRIARADEERVGVAFQISHPADRELIRNPLEAAAPEAENAHGRAGCRNGDGEMNQHPWNAHASVRPMHTDVLPSVQFVDQSGRIRDVGAVGGTSAPQELGP